MTGYVNDFCGKICISLIVSKDWVNDLLHEGFIVILFGCICYIILRGVIFAFQKSFNWFRECIKLLFFLYILMVISVTLFPITIGTGPGLAPSYRSLNFIPLITILANISQIGTAYGGDTLFMIQLILKNVGGNILLFMPLGFLLPILWERFKRLKNTVLIALLVSVCIESLQLLELRLNIAFARAVDIDDVICNVFGAFLGYLLYRLLLYVLQKKNLAAKVLKG
jgi:glycopeptide antibiotics resistance protein